MFKKTKFFYRLKNSLTGRVLINTGWSSAATPINIGLGIIQFGILARMVGPEGVGRIALFGAICALLGSIFKLNSSETVLVYTTKATVEKDSAQTSHMIRYCYFVDFLTSLVAFSAVAVSAIFLPHLLNLPPNQKWLQVLFGFSLIFQSTNGISHGLLRFTNRFSWIFYQSCSQSMIKLVVMATLFLCGAGLAEVVFLLVGLSLLDGFSLYALAHLALRRVKTKSVKPSVRWWSVPSEIRRFQTLGYGRGILKAVYGYVDILAIGYISTAISVGLFRSAKQLIGFLNIPTQALAASLSPEYSRLWFSGDIKRLRRLVLRFSFLLYVVFGILILCMVLLIDPIIRIVLGNAFLSVKEPFLILLLAAMISMAMIPLNTLQVATGRAGPSTVAGVATVVTQAILLLVLVPEFGISGAAWAKVGGLAVSAVIMLPTGIMRLWGLTPNGLAMCLKKQRVSCNE